MKIKVEMDLQLPNIPRYFRTNPKNDIASVELGQLTASQVGEYLSEYSKKFIKEHKVQRKKYLKSY